MMKKIIPLFTTLLLLGWSINAGPSPAKRPPARRSPSAAAQPTSTLT